MTTAAGAVAPRVVHLTSVHPATDTRIRFKECASLRDAGWDVVLVAAHDGPDPEDGVRLERIRRPRTRWERLTRTGLQVYRAATAARGDLYHFHDPELMVVGLLLRWRGCRVIYDVHEDVPATMLYKYYLPTWLRPILAWLINRVERIVARRFNAVVAATPTIQDRFAAVRRPVVLVQNFPRLGEMDGAVDLPYGQRDPSLVYLGVISEARGALQMVRAMGMVPARVGARLHLAGAFSPANLRTAASRDPGWDSVVEHGVVDRGGVARLLGSVRAGLVLLHPEPNYLLAYATKMFEYMAAGLPMVASNFPLWRRIVTEAGCGLLVDPLDPRQIAEAITYLLEHPAEAAAMGERGRHAVQERYNWGREAAKLIALYQALLSGLPGTSARPVPSSIATTNLGLASHDRI